MVSPTLYRAAEFKSAYGPKYSFQPHYKGFSATAFKRVGFTAAAYGGAGGVALLLFVSGLPRVKKDILQNLPFIGGYFITEVHPADNPF